MAIGPDVLIRISVKPSVNENSGLLSLALSSRGVEGMSDRGALPSPPLGERARERRPFQSLLFFRRIWNQ
jgi:hypothetical protein